MARFGRDHAIRLEVAQQRAVYDTGAILGQLHHLCARGRLSPVPHRSANERRDVSRVVHRRVPVLDCPDCRPRAEVREHPVEVGAAEVMMPGEGAFSPAQGREHVVEGDARPHEGPLPHPMTQGIKEGHGAHEVGSDRRQEKVALGQRLEHQLEIEHLKVAEPSVHELARARRRSRAPVLRFDDHRLQTSAGRIKGDAGTGDTAPDDEHVEFSSRQCALGQARKSAVARFRGEPSVEHDVPFMRTGGMSPGSLKRIRIWKHDGNTRM